MSRSPRGPPAVSSTSATVHAHAHRGLLQRFTAQALRSRVVIVALLVVFVSGGIAAFRELPVEAYPDVTNVQVQIITLFPGHAAEEVEQLVTVPVENEMNGIPKRAAMRSISLFGLSVVTLVFEDDADPAYVRNQAFERLQAVDLPAGARRLKQKAAGLMATVVNGEVVLRNNEHTGALPGKLLRGPLARR